MSEIDKDKWEKAKQLCDFCTRQYPSFDAAGDPYHPIFGGYGEVCTAKSIWLEKPKRPQEMTREELLVDNEHLRTRIKEIQDKSDQRESELSKIIHRLSMELSIVEGVKKIGQTFFWDIAKCAEKPLNLSQHTATILGAKIVTSFLGIDSTQFEKTLNTDFSTTVKPATEPDI